MQAEPASVVRSGRIDLPWAAALAAIMQLGQLRTELVFALVAEGEAQERLKAFREERRIVEAARNNALPLIDPDRIAEKLIESGFTRRVLRDFQLRDLAKLLSLKHGANFSVPGAGKTSVTFALHLLACPAGHGLMVIAPKNAFSAWESVVEECMSQEFDHGRGDRFIRVDDSRDDLLALSRGGARRFLIGYDRFVKLESHVSVMLRQVPTHLVIDEAHRIKAGEFSQRGRAVLAVAPLPTRRDILTGTPAPHSLEDLRPQLNFLWPGSSLSQLAVEAPVPRTVLAPFYVRTTKQELNLTPPIRQFIHVVMGPSQLALYSLLRSEALRQLAGIRNRGSATDIIKARRCVMRLLQASTNPIAAVAAFDSSQSRDDAQLNRLFQAVVEEGDSNKILRAVEFCETCRRNKRKVVVWTIFRHTIARLESLMSHLNARSIFGETPTGSDGDDATREGRIKRFHDDPECWVLVANPAACSEGISLHTVCHEALYVDRSYNAAHYLQSIDRIHRLGLDPDVNTNITILQSVAPHQVGSIDHSVSRRLLSKMRAMESILDDQDIRQLALDEEEASPPVDRDITLDDLADLFEQLTAQSIPDVEDQI
ncbi:DEAD/DEAH box helicase [soil metagenome]